SGDGRGGLLGEAEVEQLDLRRRAGPAGTRKHDIARLQIAVDDAGGVRAVERAADLTGDPQRLVDGQRSALEPRGERLALQVLHDNEAVADVVERADVGMRELRDRAGFAVEALPELRVGGDRRGQHLDRHRPIEARVAGLVDLAHSAGAQERLNLVRAESGADVQTHRRGPDYTAVERFG